MGRQARHDALCAAGGLVRPTHLSVVCTESGICLVETNNGTGHSNAWWSMRNHLLDSRLARYGRCETNYRIDGGSTHHYSWGENAYVNIQVVPLVEL